jgi:hypothetical protein
VSIFEHKDWVDKGPYYEKIVTVDNLISAQVRLDELKKGVSINVKLSHSYLGIMDNVTTCISLPLGTDLLDDHFLVSHVEGDKILIKLYKPYCDAQ